MSAISSVGAIRAVDRSLPKSMRDAAGQQQTARQFPAQLKRFSYRVAVLCLQGVLTTFAYASSVALLSEAYAPGWAPQILHASLPWLICLRLLGLLFLGSCELSLRSASIRELMCVTKTVTCSSLAFWAITRFALEMRLPPALLILDWMVSIALLAGLHFGFQLYKAQRAIARSHGKRALVIGAGDAGASIVKELVLNPSATVLPVGLVDDDPQKHGTKIYGVPVLGGLPDLARLAREHRADEVLICIPSATRSQMKSILAQCGECEIPVRALPSLAELINGEPGLRDFHSLPVEDLLQRDEVTPDPVIVRGVVGDRIVLVTGAGGSIGSELCRQIAAAGPRKLLLLEKSENSLFYIHLELQERFPMVPMEPLLVDVTCRDRVREIFEGERPEVVFHAAAHKHVHLQELHPHEAVRNNVLGTRNVAFAAREFGVGRFVNISTDKAVSPRNYMGLSKKMTEILIRELAQSGPTRFMNVRFGNVAGSTGSVLRLFWDRIQKRAPIRITDARATRYFMTIKEAVCLILHAAAQGRGGETFVFDMGKPLNIYKMARTLSLFSGLAPGKDLPIEFVGLKEGEKITEELWEQWERPAPTAQSRVLALSGAVKLPGGILEEIQELERLLARADYLGVIARLRTVFPEFAAVHKAPAGVEKRLRRPTFHNGGLRHERATVVS